MLHVKLLILFNHCITKFVCQTQLELKVEDMASTKQKAMRRLTEMKEEATRESSLRASLEESHSTLLTRLQDMEAVIETLRAEVHSG